MTKTFEIYTPNEMHASGAFPNLIPNDNLSAYLRDVECRIVSGGSIDWLSVEQCPSPNNTNTLAIQMHGVFQNIQPIYEFVFDFLGNNLDLQSLLVVGNFSIQKEDSMYNANHYMSILDYSSSQLTMQLDMKDLVLDANETLQFSMNLNVY